MVRQSVHEPYASFVIALNDVSAGEDETTNQVSGTSVKAQVMDQVRGHSFSLPPTATNEGLCLCLIVSIIYLGTYQICHHEISLSASFQR